MSLTKLSLVEVEAAAKMFSVDPPPALLGCNTLIPLEAGDAAVVDGKWPKASRMLSLNEWALEASRFLDMTPQSSFRGFNQRLEKKSRLNFAV